MLSALRAGPLPFAQAKTNLDMRPMKSASRGVAEYLGLRYAGGQGVAKDERKAAQLYRKACDGGQEASCGLLGFMYALGRGVARDERKAVRGAGRRAKISWRESERCGARRISTTAARPRGTR